MSLKKSRELLKLLDEKNTDDIAAELQKHYDELDLIELKMIAEKRRQRLINYKINNIKRKQRTRELIVAGAELESKVHSREVERVRFWLNDAESCIELIDKICKKLDTYDEEIIIEAIDVALRDHDFCKKLAEAQANF